MAAQIDSAVSSDPRVQRFIDQVVRNVNPALRNPLLDGRLIAGADLVGGDNTVSHGLGRALRGWIPVMQNAGVTLYDKQDSNSTPDRTLILNASAAVTVSLYVF